MRSCRISVRAGRLLCRAAGRILFGADRVLPGTGRILLLGAVLLAAPGLLAMPGSLAAQRTLTLESFHAELQVQASGDLQVTETLRPRFQGSWNGLYRNLSLAHQTAQERRERLDLDILAITDEAGDPLRYESSNEGRWTRRLQIWVPGAEDATRTVIIRYVVHNAIRFFDEMSETGPLDELYWNVTGNEWEIPIERATAQVMLPEGLAPTQSAAYTGAAGSTERAVRSETDGNVVRFTATRSLSQGEGLTVAVGWPPGVVAHPPPPSLLVTSVGRWSPLVLPFLVFFLAYGAWDKRGRDPKARAIAVQYEPPEKLGPAEIGTLVDHRAEMHDVTATLVDLAVRGYIHIEQIKEKTLGIFSHDEYVFRLEKPEGEWTGLNTHEKRYLQALFKLGPSVRLSELKNKFYKDLKGIRSALYEQLIGKGHYRQNPETVKGKWILGAMGLLMAGVGGAVWASEAGPLFLDPLTLGAAGILSGLIVLVFGQLMPARTVKGARAREAALGFKEFLTKVEEPRFKRMITSPEMFERYLAYAMAFKVESKWAKAFEEIYTDPPRWYTGYAGSTFHPGSFTHDLAAMSTAASSTMASSPSGSGGGGSSGGGSGGGGGGGF